MASAYTSDQFYAAGDDAFRALRCIGNPNYILVLIPTSPQEHEFNYQPLVDEITKTYHKNVLTMDYTPSMNKNVYLPFDRRHEDALNDPDCAGVIIVIQDDMTKTMGSQMDFARKVWEVAVEDQEIPGVLVEIGGRRRPVGSWKTILYSEKMGEGNLKEVARLIFGY